MVSKKEDERSFKRLINSKRAFETFKLINEGRSDYQSLMKEQSITMPSVFEIIALLEEWGLVIRKKGEDARERTFTIDKLKLREIMSIWAKEKEDFPAIKAFNKNYAEIFNGFVKKEREKFQNDFIAELADCPSFIKDFESFFIYYIEKFN